jgi:glutamyl-tRNA reductase
MYEGAERTKERELETALTKLEAQGGLSAEQRETVEALADALVGQLLAAPTKSLRDAAQEDDWDTIHTAMGLFDPEFDGTTVDAPDVTSSDAVDESTGSPEAVGEHASND